MKSIESTEITGAGSPAGRTTLGVAILAIGGLVAGGLTGCATTATPSPQLEKARSEVQAASQDPDAARAGGVRLATAQEALEKAESAFDKGNHTAEDNYAYSATRNAQIAREQAAASRARKAVEAGEAERNRVVIESRSREAEKARSETARLKAELAELKAKQTDRGMVLTLGDVLFDTNKATVRAGAISNLQRLASVMQEQTGLKVIVEGHTDSTGAAEYNRELSMRRAQAVANVLMRSGVAADRVRPIGLGEDFPVASNDTATGRQQNRRVEVVFSDEGGKFAPGAERRSF
ncbi:MAG: OmpA family protein [Gammaproteobacteria bacterium]